MLGLVWQFIFSNILPSVGQTLGLSTLSKSLISNKDTVMITLVTVNTWQYAGYIMLIYVAAIQGISKSVMEAAEVDGARYWTRVTKIQIPLMANAFTISLFLTLTNSFKMYDVNVALTNGGPVALFMSKPVQASELLARQKDLQLASHDALLDAPGFDAIAALADSLMTDFAEKRIDRVELVYNQFKNSLSQVLTCEQWLPVAPKDLKASKEFKVFKGPMSLRAFVNVYFFTSEMREMTVVSREAPVKIHCMSRRCSSRALRSLGST